MFSFQLHFFRSSGKHLYDVSSASEKGTLYAARNYLNARNVTADPIKNINAAEHLLSQYAIALILAAAFNFFGLDNQESEPTKNKFQLEIHGDKQHYATTVMHKLVEDMAIPSNNELGSDSTGFSCSICNRKYASKKNLRKHQRDKHQSADKPPSSTTSESPILDGVQNYSRAALAMCLLFMDFSDARKCGDGARIIHLYKFLLLHCKAAKKPKYSFHILRALAQVHVFLSPRLSYEMTWNRFANSSGRPDGNVEPDRVLEHHNRVFQENVHGIRGKLTQKNVDRISHSAQEINNVLQHINKEMAIKSRGSSKHKVLSHDAVTLACELHKEDIFGFHPGRTHYHFQGFPVSVLSTLNVAEFHDWIKATVKKFYRQQQFESH